MLLAVYFGWREYSLEKEKKEIERLIASDTRFQGMQMHRKGSGIFLSGQFSSTNDCDAFYAQVNKVKDKYVWRLEAVVKIEIDTSGSK